MTYRVLYSRFDEETSRAMLVEDDIEATRFGIKSGCLIFYRDVEKTDENGDSYKIEQPFFTVPAGAWIMVEPAKVKEPAERHVVARNAPTPSGLVLPR